MKKTIQVNINGKIYQIDEDAYQLLQNYLAQLRDAFPGDEGIEIVNDIESRISEHFDQRQADGVSIIVIEDVNRVIGVMGRPDEITDECGFEASQSPNKIEVDVSSSATEDGDGHMPPVYAGPSGTATPPQYHKKLFRDERHKVFGGVIAGFSQYLGWDVTIFRILVVVCTLALSAIDIFWPIIFGYLICWMVIPPARSPRQILEMKGEPVTVDNVGQTVIDTSVPPVAPVPDGNGATNAINNIFLVIGRIILVMLGVIGGLVGFATSMVGLAILAGIGCLYFASEDMITSMFGVSAMNPYLDGWGLALLMFSLSLPAWCLCRAGIATLFNAPSMSKTTIVVIIVVELLLLLTACVLFGLSHATPNVLGAFA